MTVAAVPDNERWIGRPGVALLIRVFVWAAPVVVSIVFAWVLTGLLPHAGSFGWAVIRWLAIAVTSTVVLVVVDKAARRLLPLATLFGLTLAFPDRAPSRFRLALRNGSTAQLRIRIADARAGRLTDTPESAAEHVLELVMALNLHDRLTRGHSERVRAYTQMIGEEMGLSETELDRIRWSGLLHDIGKLRISGKVLNKPGKLTDDEFATIKLHPEFGRELVGPLLDWLGESARAVWEHHERWDGCGYPNRLSGTEISLAGRIVAVADAYDVITSVRSYKRAIAPADARAELIRCSGTQFDPVVVRAFMNLSLGRLRLAMGPLSWLAQLPLFPQTLAATASAGTGTAATALVGAAAASVGLGLASDPVVRAERQSFDATAVTARPFEEEEDVDTGPRNTPARDGSPGAAAEQTTGGDGRPTPNGEDAGDDGVPASTPIDGVPDDVAPTTSTVAPGTITPGTITPAVTGATTTIAADDDSPTTTARTNTTTPSTTTATTVRSTSTTTTPTPAVTVPTTTLPPVVTVAPTTIAVTTTTAAPAPTVTTAAPTTTIPPRPGWLPPAGVPTPLYFDVVGSVDAGAHPVLPLVRNAPTSLAVVDGDGDGRAGITLRRDAGELSFALTAPTDATVVGAASGTAYVSTAQLLALNVTVRARLLVCDVGNTCAQIAESTRSALVTALPLPIVFDLGSVDTVIPANGSLRLTLDVPTTSSGDALVSADSTLTPSNITVTFG